MGITISSSNPGIPVLSEMEDKEFLNLAYSLSEVKPSITGQVTHIEVSWECLKARPSNLSSLSDSFLVVVGHPGTSESLEEF